MRSFPEDLRALSHPTRYIIVEELARGDLSFSELMREIGIEDSSLLIFHINKLKGIVEKQNNRYSLTSKGRILHSHLATLQDQLNKTDVYERPRKRLSLSDRIWRLVPGLPQLEEGRVEAGKLLFLVFIWLVFCTGVMSFWMLSWPELRTPLDGAILLVLLISCVVNVVTLSVFSQREVDGESSRFLEKHLYLIASFGWGLPHLFSSQTRKGVIYLFGLSMCALAAWDLGTWMFVYPILLLIQFSDLGSFQSPGNIWTAKTRAP